jgi:hypothetical protein
VCCRKTAVVADFNWSFIFNAILNIVSGDLGPPDAACVPSLKISELGSYKQLNKDLFAKSLASNNK